MLLPNLREAPRRSPRLAHFRRSARTPPITVNVLRDAEKAAILVALALDLVDRNDPGASFSGPLHNREKALLWRGGEKLSASRDGVLLPKAPAKTTPDPMIHADADDPPKFLTDALKTVRNET